MREELPEGHAVVVLSISNVEHSMDHTQGIPVLKLRSFLKKLKSRMNSQNLFKEHLKVVNGKVLFLRVTAQ